MNGWLLTLLRMSAAGALAILAVLLARLALGRFPRKYVCLLWLVVLFRLLCPVTLRAPTSVVPEAVESGEAVTAWTERYAEETRVIQRGEPGYTEAVHAGRIPVWVDAPASLPEAAELPPDYDQSSLTAKSYVVTAADGVSAPQRAGEVWLPVLGWGWLGGAAALSAWSLCKYLRLRFRLREAVKLEEGVYEAEGLASPFVLGVLRPKIYLPWGMGEESRAWVLRHERSHVRRLDPLWKLLGWLALCLHWFNPLCWLAFSLAMSDMERACDEAVIGTLDGEARSAYSELLLRLSAGRPLFAATPLGFGEGNVKKRIQSILRWRKPKWWMAALAVLLLAAVVLLFALGPSRAHKDFQGFEDTPDAWPSLRFFKQEWTEVCAGQRGVWPVSDVKGLKKELAELLKEGEWHVAGIADTVGEDDTFWRRLCPGKIRWVSGGKSWALYLGQQRIVLVSGDFENDHLMWIGHAVGADGFTDEMRMEALLALTERGKPELSLEPEADLCFAGLPWGCTIEEARSALPVAVRDGLTLRVTDAAVCGFRAAAELTFEQDEQGTFLNAVALTFTEEAEQMTLERFNRAALCEDLSVTWGGRQHFLPYLKGVTGDLEYDYTPPERLWYWYTADFSDEDHWMSGVTAWFERKGEPRVLYIDASGRNLAAGRQFTLRRSDLTEAEANRLYALAASRLSENAVVERKRVVRETWQAGDYDAFEFLVWPEEDYKSLSEALAVVPWFIVTLGEADPAPDPAPGPEPAPEGRYPVAEGWEKLSAAELGEWIAATHTYVEDGAGNWVYNTLSCCFTSRYTDPTELDLYEFLRYYDFTEEASEEEFRALSAAGLIGALNPWWHAEDYFVPLHRVPAAQVEAELQRYFGIGLGDLKTDYRLCCDYLPEYDCFYLRTSDWGPGTFQPQWGEKQGENLRLWRGYTSLSLHWQEDRWVIDSFLSEGVEPNTGANALRSRTVRVYEGRWLSREAEYVFIPADVEYRSEPRGESDGVFRAGTRLLLKSEYLYNDGELWLEVSEETYNAPAETGWVRPAEVEVWTGSAEQEAALRSPVWLPAQSIYYPANFGDGASDSMEECVTPENVRTHGYDLNGSIVALEGDYALVSLGQLEVWVRRNSLIAGIPLQHTPEPELKYLAYGREAAQWLGHPLADWGAELVWHRGKAEGEEHYTAYYPTADGSGTVAAVFTPGMESQPQRIVLIPPGAEDWP